ncbi:glomulin, FKBP associated protein a isoform X2 [Sardina pilchardus]
MGWNLVGPLVQVRLKNEEKDLSHSHAILTHLLEICSSKELLVSLLEQVEAANQDAITETVTFLLQPLQKVLLNFGRKKAAFLGMTLSTLLDQIARLPVSSMTEQQEDAAGLCRWCSGLLWFVKPFVEEAKHNHHSGVVHDEELRIEILKFCMKSLKEPLLGVQFTDPDQLAKSFLHEFSREILVILYGIGEPLPELLCHKLLKKRDVPGFLEEEVRYPKESLANIAYLLFVHHIGIETFPVVLSPVFILQCNMEYVELLLCRTEESHLQRGLDLYEKSLIRVEDNSLSVELLELKTFVSVPQNLVKVMTQCPVHRLRSKGLSVFQLSINKFNIEAKYKFLRCMFKTSHHSGVEGVITKNIKNLVDFSLKPGNENIWFQGIHFLPLLRLVLCLPQGPETDLLQNLDRIMESLNLLRYLLIRDKECDNETGIWLEVNTIHDRFLKPLRLGLNMSKAHYQAQLNNTQVKNTNKENDSGAVCTITVGNEILPNLTPELQSQALHSALFTFELIESVLVRIEEIMETIP